MNWYDNVILPKVWTEVIRRWWDVTVPKDYPTDTGVEFTLDFGDNKQAVEDMEASLKTENPIVAPYVPENTYVQNYVGVFEAEGEGGEQVLLSPVQVPANASGAIALHYNANTDGWDNVENVNIVDGYVYGDVETLSPIAVFTYHDDIEYKEIDGINGVFGKGNSVKVITDAEDGKVYATNPSSGKKIEIDTSKNIFVYGGSYDGTDYDVTSVAVDGVTAEKLRIYCGSCGNDNIKVPVVGVAKAYVVNSTINGVSGSYYKCHTKKLEITIKDSHIKNHIGAGQSMFHGSKNKDGNAYPLSNASDFVTDEVVMNLENTKTLIFYVGGTSGLTYTKKAVANAKNCDFGWTCAGSSNGLIDEGTMIFEDCKCTNIEAVNRGTIKSASVVLKGTSSELGIFVAGDSTDTSVDGTVEEVRYDIDKGCSGTLFLGTNGGEELKDNACVKFVKYSRSTDVEIGDDVKNVLGDKLKMK